jgi:hypothetical protein
MLMRSKLAVLLILVLAACTGSNAPDPNASGSGTPNPGQRGVEGQRVTLAAGADVAAAALVRYCASADVCERPSTRPPAGRLEVDEPRPVLSIALELKPDSVIGRVLRGGKKSKAENLKPGTLVAWRPLVKPGRSELRVIATYGEQRIEWRTVIRRF